MKKQESDSPLKRVVKNKSHTESNELKAAKDEVWSQLAQSRQRIVAEKQDISQKTRSRTYWPALAAIALAGTVLIFTIDFEGGHKDKPAVALAESKELRTRLNKSGFPSTKGSLVKATPEFDAILYEKPEAFILKLKAGGFSATFTEKLKKPVVIEALGNKVTVTGTTFAININKQKLNIQLYEGSLYIVTDSGATTKLTAGHAYQDGTIITINKTAMVALGKLYQKAIGKIKSVAIFKATHTITLKDGSEFKAKLLKGDSDYIRVQLASGKEKKIAKSELQFMQPIN